MILVRDEITCKQGDADEFVNRFKAMSSMLSGQDVIKTARVLTDLSGRFDTVVTEIEVESLDAYYAMMKAQFANLEADADPTDELTYQFGSRTLYTIEAFYEANG